MRQSFVSAKHSAARAAAKRGGAELAVITIVGAGMMGSALAFPARENGHTVRLVGTPLDREIIDACRASGKHPKFDRPFPAGVCPFQIEALPAALEGADVIIGGVSSFGVDWFGETVLPLLPDGAVLLTVTKGLSDTPDGKLLTYPQLWEEKAAALGKHFFFNAVGGPCTSYELVAHDMTEVTFCGKNRAVLEKLKSLLTTSYYHISLSADVTGIETAVALKNGYALGVALTIGLCRQRFGQNSPQHYNSQAAIFGSSLKEMQRLLAFQHAASLHNLSVGIGDLYVTVFGGRTRQAGILLGSGLTIDETKARLEGVTLESLVVAERVARAVRRNIEKGALRKEDFPLLLHIDDLITGKKPADIPWEALTCTEGFDGDAEGLSET